MSPLCSSAEFSFPQHLSSKEVIVATPGLTQPSEEIRRVFFSCCQDSMSHVWCPGQLCFHQFYGSISFSGPFVPDAQPRDGRSQGPLVHTLQILVAVPRAVSAPAEGVTQVKMLCSELRFNNTPPILQSVKNIPSVFPNHHPLPTFGTCIFICIYYLHLTIYHNTG